MADVGSLGEDDADRLELALDRIARARARQGVAVDVADLTSRLDTLIAELRAVLNKDGGD